MKNNIKKLPLLLLLLLFIFCLIAIFYTPTWGDEKYYHYPNAKIISLNEIIESNSSYSSAYPPLPYIIGSAFLNFYDSVYTLRLVNFLIVVIFGIFIFRIGRKLGKDPLLFTLLIMANPYLLRAAFTYYMFAYGLLFVTIAIYYRFFSTYKYNNLIAHIFLGLAVFSQQWMLVVVFAFFIVDFISSGEFSSPVRKISESILLKILVLFPDFILFYIWKGLTHPNFQEHAIKPSFEHLTGVLTNWGLALFFLVLFYYRDVLKTKHIPFLFIIPLIFLAIPEQSCYHGIDQITGITAQIAVQLENYLHLSYNVTTLILSIFGLLSFILIINKDDKGLEGILKYSTLGFFIAFTASTNLGASHVFVSLPFLVLIFYEEINKKPVFKYLLLCQFLVISITYIVYISFFRSHGISI